MLAYDMAQDASLATTAVKLDVVIGGDEPLPSVRKRWSGKVVVKPVWRCRRMRIAKTEDYYSRRSKIVVEEKK